jgi:CO/xanthine dehydrogenase Mo-binding subunit
VTGFLHEKEFSRKSFLKGGGAMVVGFSLVGAATGAQVAKAAFNPPVNLVDSWITIFPNNTLELKTSHIDPGNGAPTGFMAIVAEEMNISMDQINHSVWDTNLLVNSGSTGGSTAIQNTGPNVRAAAAYAYQALLSMAATNLGVPVSSLSVDKGVVSGGGKSVTYGALVGGKLINATIPTAQLNPGQGISKPVAQYKLVGTRFPRKTIPEKVSGKYTYVHNVRVPGMLHGRVVRPRGQGGYGSGAPIVSVDTNSVSHIPGVKVVRAGDFLGVVAPREYDAIQAAAQLKVTWKENPILASSGNLWANMRKQDTAGLAPARISMDVNGSAGNVDASLKASAKVIQQSYKYHYNGHMPIGPCCAVADVKANSATIFSSTQAIEGMVTAIQQLLGFADPNQVRAFWYEGSSSFGPGNRYVDTAKAAAIMSKLAGAPVRVQLMRWDEHGWNAYGPGQLMDVRVGADASGKLLAYDYTLLAQPGSSLDMTQELLGTLVYGQNVLSTATSIYPTPGTASPNTPNTGPMYESPALAKRLIGKTMPLFQGYFQDGALRDPAGPQTSFASEQAMDELAYALNMDPLEFRRKNITDARWLGVLNAAAQASNWQPRVAHSVKQTGDVLKGRGFGFGRHGTEAYAAGVVEIEVNKKTGVITTKHVYNAVDAGLSVGLELVENQMTGASVQGVSRALYEEVRFNKSRVTSLDWISYPILRFKDHPAVTNVIIQRTDQVPIGVGEPATTPAAPAIANAFFDATGVRIREAPMTPARVRATLKAAGIS